MMSEPFKRPWNTTGMRIATSWSAYKLETVDKSRTDFRSTTCGRKFTTLCSPEISLQCNIIIHNWQCRQILKKRSLQGVDKLRSQDIYSQLKITILATGIYSYLEYMPVAKIKRNRHVILSKNTVNVHTLTGLWV